MPFGRVFVGLKTQVHSTQLEIPGIDKIENLSFLKLCESHDGSMGRLDIPIHEWLISMGSM